MLIEVLVEVMDPSFVCLVSSREACGLAGSAWGGGGFTSQVLAESLGMDCGRTGLPTALMFWKYMSELEFWLLLETDNLWF